MTTPDIDQIKLNKKTLSFPPSIETDFQDKAVLSNQSFSTAVVIFLCGVNFLVQYLNFGRFEILPSLLLMPLPLLMLASVRINPSGIRQWLYGIILIFSGLSVISIMAISPDHLFNFTYLAVLIIAGILFLKIKYFTSAGIGFALMVAYVAVMQHFTVQPGRMIFNQALFLCLMILVGAAAAYMIEYYSRIVYLKEEVLDRMIKNNRLKENRNNKELYRINKSLGLEISAHLEAESQLKEREENYRNLVDFLPQGLFIVQDDRIVFSNPRFREMTGYGEQELLGMSCDTVLNHFDTPEHTGGTGADIYDGLRHKDGRMLLAETNVVPIQFNMSKALLYSVQDVTEKVAAQKEQDRLKKELERAKKMEVVGLLAGGVAHDLNNVLAGIVSAPDMLLADLPQDSPLRDHALIIKDAGRRSAVIVDDLLTLARGSKKQPEPVQLNHVIEDYFHSPECTALLERFPCVVVEKSLASALPHLEGSGMQLRKIVMNLVSNAVEAVGQNKGRVLVSTEWIMDSTHPIRAAKGFGSGDIILLQVLDTGPGIPDEDIDRIFEPFYSRKIPGRSGTGLGLSIVWNAVKDHGGQIQVACREGRTIFSLYFNAGDTGEKLQEKSYSGVLTMDDYAGSGQTILVIDDMETQLKISSNMLKRLGYRVIKAENGEKAVKIAQSEQIDLALIDMILEPGMHGLETFEQLLLIDPEIKAIMTSGYAETPEVKKARQLGAGPFIKKPFTLEKIGLAIKNELSDRDET